MKCAFRAAACYLALSRSCLNPSPFPISAAISRIRNTTLASTALMSSYQQFTSTTVSLEKQFDDFRHQLDASGSLRDRIKAVVVQIESANRLIHANLLLVHQSLPVPEVLEKSKTQIHVLNNLYKELAGIMGECPGEYYRYNGEWRTETQTVVSLLAYMHWLETGSLLLHNEAEEKLGLDPSKFGLDIEEYLIGICFMSNELPRYAVNQVTAGDYDCPRKVLKFLTDLHAAFRMLNLRNDFLRKKFDGMKYDLRKVEEVYYDVKIRGLAVNGNSDAEFPSSAVVVIFTVSGRCWGTGFGGGRVLRDFWRLLLRWRLVGVEVVSVWSLVRVMKDGFGCLRGDGGDYFGCWCLCGANASFGCIFLVAFSVVRRGDGDFSAALYSCFRFHLGVVTSGALVGAHCFQSQVVVASAAGEGWVPGGAKVAEGGVCWCSALAIGFGRRGLDWVLFVSCR
ncbi:unnamed protein product [Rhodiola kirilowii]